MKTFATIPTAVAVVFTVGTLVELSTLIRLMQPGSITSEVWPRATARFRTWRASAPAAQDFNFSTIRSDFR
jgi:hypothetical protein